MSIEQNKLQDSMEYKNSFWKGLKGYLTMILSTVRGKFFKVSEAQTAKIEWERKVEERKIKTTEAKIAWEQKQMDAISKASQTTSEAKSSKSAEKDEINKATDDIKGPDILEKIEADQTPKDSENTTFKEDESSIQSTEV